MKVLFLTEYGEGTGYGHINRCTALADGFSANNCEITFISSGDSGEFIIKRDYKFINKQWYSRPFLKEILPDFDITVTDSYLAPDDILKYVGKKANAPVYLIDSTLKYYPAGTVIFPSVYVGSFNFDEHPQVEVIKGIEYLLFTREFWNINKAKPSKKMKRIGISLGGITNESVARILSILREILSGAVKIKLFGEPDDSVNQNKLLDRCEVRGFLQKEQYVKEIIEMDAMICNGGQTLNECLLLGLPTISLICAGNQKKNAEAWKQLGVTIVMDIRNEWKESEFREKVKALSHYPQRKEFNNKCRNLIDHKGAMRVAKKIIDTTG